MAFAYGCGQQMAERSSSAAGQKGGNAWLSLYPRNKGGARCGAFAAYQPAQAVEGLSATQPAGCANGISTLRRSFGRTAA
jgi:hypothetical protein